MIFVLVKLTKKKKKNFQNEILHFDSSFVSIVSSRDLSKSLLISKKILVTNVKKKRHIFIKIKYPLKVPKIYRIEGTIRAIEFLRYKKFRSTYWSQDGRSVFVSCQLRVINRNIISLINLSQGYQVWGSSFSSPSSSSPSDASYLRRYSFAQVNRKNNQS